MTGEPQKEISFIAIMKSIFKGLKIFIIWLIKLLGAGSQLLYRHKVITVLIMAMSLAIGWYLTRAEKKEYNISAMAIINGASAQTVREIAKPLEWSSYVSDHASLPQLLSLPPAIANNFYELQSFYMIDYGNDSIPDIIDWGYSYTPEDTLSFKMQNRLFFTLKGTNVRFLPQYQEAFLKYFNENPLLKREFEIKKQTLEERLLITDKEIKRIDSMATLCYLKGDEINLRISRKDFSIGSEKQLFYDDLFMLYKKKIDFESELASFTEPMVLPSDFAIHPRPNNGRSKVLTISGLIGLGVIVFLCLFIENRKCIFSYLSKRQKIN